MDTIIQRNKPLTSFTIFSSLPTELRLKIFRHACFSRVLTLSYTPATDSFARCPSPALLSVNSEARAEALRIYTPFFATSSQEAHIYFNPYLDTIYLPRLSRMGYDDTLRDFKKLVRAPENSLNDIEHIAIDHVCMDIKRPWESYNKFILLSGFRNLKDVTLVLADENVQGGANVRLVEPRIDPERQLRIWYHFRQAMAGEEKVWEESCRANGRAYEGFKLPTLRIKAKVEDRGAGDLQRAMGRMVL